MQAICGIIDNPMTGSLSDTRRPDWTQVLNSQVSSIHINVPLCIETDFKRYKYLSLEEQKIFHSALRASVKILK